MVFNRRFVFHIKTDLNWCSREEDDLPELSFIVPDRGQPKLVSQREEHDLPEF